MGGVARIVRRGFGKVLETAIQEDPMSNTDDLKGRVKEAAGDLTGNERLEREGKADRAEGKVKDAVDGARDKLGDMADKVRDKLD